MENRANAVHRTGERERSSVDVGARGQCNAAVPHQVLRHRRSHPCLLQPMVEGVAEGMEMQLSGGIVEILDARPFQIVPIGFPPRKNVEKYEVCGLRLALVA